MAFELVCSGVPVQDDVRVARELGNGPTEPGGAVGGGGVGGECDARQGSGDVRRVRLRPGECQLEQLGKGCAGFVTLAQPERREAESLSASSSWYLSPLWSCVRAAA